MARRVALSASDRRRVSLTSHEAAGGPVERRVLPAAAVASLDNGALRRDAAATPGGRTGAGDLAAGASRASPRGGPAGRSGGGPDPVTRPKSGGT